MSDEATTQRSREDAVGQPGSTSAEGGRRLIDIVDRSRMASMDAMGAALAHELNQPLTALGVYLQSLQKQVRSYPAVFSQVQELVDKALKESERAVDIVRRMRRLSAHAEPVRQQIDINAVCREMVELALLGRARRPHVELRLAPDLPPLWCDAIQVQQVLVNLLKNAAQATARVAKPAITLETAVQGGMVEVTITDNGPGVDPGIADRLFRAFETNKPQGQGLGLAISRMIAQNHGGDVLLKSNAGERGAAFALRLPLK